MPIHIIWIPRTLLIAYDDIQTFFNLIQAVLGFIFEIQIFLFLVHLAFETPLFRRGLFPSLFNRLAQKVFLRIVWPYPRSGARRRPH